VHIKAGECMSHDEMKPKDVGRTELPSGAMQARRRLLLECLSMRWREMAAGRARLTTNAIGPKWVTGNTFHYHALSSRGYRIFHKLEDYRSRVESRDDAIGETFLAGSVKEDS